MTVGSVTATSSSSTTQLLAAASKAVVTDPRDTNKDGKVSAEEARQWALTHPSAESSDSATASAADDKAGTTSKRVDLSA